MVVMEWVRIAITVWLCFGVLVTIGQVDKPREPISSGTASLAAILTALMIWGIWLL